MASMRLIDAAADLLLGAACPACRAPGLGPCPTCRARLLNAEPTLVRHRHLDVPVWAAAAYRPLLEHLIPAFKDDGHWGQARVLGLLLARAVMPLAPPPEARLVPVPSRPEAVRRRGIDHGRVLAARAARHAHLRWRPAVRRTGGGHSQRGLNRSERATLTEEDFHVKPVPGPVIVVDDVITTGATLRAVVAALRTGGAMVIGAAVVANADCTQ